MRLTNFFKKKEPVEEPGLPGLLKELDKYFDIGQPDNFDKSTENVLYAHLNTRSNSPVPQMPVKLKYLSGTMYFLNSDLQNLNNMPDLVSTVIVDQETPLALSSNEPIKMATLSLSLPRLQSLKNSGNLTVGELSLYSCNRLVTLEGLETFIPLKDKIHVSIHHCPFLRDSLHHYPFADFYVSVRDTFPEHLPIVHMLAYFSSSPISMGKELLLQKITKMYSEVADHIDGGAHSIIPLVRYFRSIKQQHRIDKDYQ